MQTTVISTQLREVGPKAELASRGMSASGALVDPLFSSVISSRRRPLEGPRMRRPRLNPPKDRFLETVQHFFHLETYFCRQFYTLHTLGGKSVALSWNLRSERRTFV